MARPRRNARGRGLELGVLLLLMDMMNMGLAHIPPATLLTVLGQILLYVGVLDVPWNKWDVCISSEKVLRGKDLKRLVLSSLEHGDDFHLYYNMVSFLVKGRSLERRYGSTNFALLLAVLTLLTSVTYVGLGQLLAQVLHDAYYAQACAIGFSGVIFALKVLTSHEAPSSTTLIAGFPVSTRYAAWVELIVIHLLVPRASFVGHLAGILVGVLYCKTFLGTILDSFITGLTGEPFVHDVSFYQQ